MTPREFQPAAATAAVALAAALALLTPHAHAATAPASDQVYRSIETPYPAPGPFHTDTTAWVQFNTVASLDYGLTVNGVNLAAAPLGSFQGMAAGVTVPTYNAALNVTLRSSADMWARTQDGADQIAFSDYPANSAFYRYVHVAALGQATNVTLLTLTFSRPVQGFAFVGAGISDAGGSPQTDYPSQRIQLDDRPMIDVLGVNPNTVYNPLKLSFGVIAAEAFSSVRLVLPGGSQNDNAALSNLLVAYDPAAVVPVPEPATLALWLAGLGALGQLSRRRAAA